MWYPLVPELSRGHHHLRQPEGDSPPGGGHLHREADTIPGGVPHPDFEDRLPQGQDWSLHPQLRGLSRQRHRGFHPWVYFHQINKFFSYFWHYRSCGSRCSCSGKIIRHAQWLDDRTAQGCDQITSNVDWTLEGSTRPRWKICHFKSLKETRCKRIKGSPGTAPFLTLRIQGPMLKNCDTITVSVIVIVEP